MTVSDSLWLAVGWSVVGIVDLMALLVVYHILNGDIDLSRLVSEPTGDASISRFQFLIFTYVVALTLFMVTVRRTPPAFPDVSGGILALLGISASTYAVSKGIQFSDPAGLEDRGADIVITPNKPLVRYGQTQQFKADVRKKPGSAVTWQVTAGPGTIDANGLYAAPPVPAPPAAGAAPAPTHHVTIQVTSNEYPDAQDLAVITLV